MKIRTVGDELFYPYGRTDGRTGMKKSGISFPQFCKRA